MFNVKENKAICILPWVQEFKSITGKKAPCCRAEYLPKGETIANIRQLMLNNIKPKVCSICHKDEEDSNWSHRLEETNQWLKKFGTPAINNPQLEYLDIRYDPTCNMKCKTCGPSASTLWQKEKGVKIDINKENQNYMHNVNKNILKKVYLAGGEPTYIKDYLIFLNELLNVNPTCEVMINTNLKKLPNAWKEIITKFKNLTIICSCDATELLGTYVRYPLEWNEFEENVKFVSDNANFLQFNLVASNLTSHKLYETCTWMKQYSKHINISILFNPEVFSEYSVPLEYRETYINNIKKLLKFPVSVYYASQFRSEINYLINKYSTAKYVKSLHNKLKDEITEQDSHRHLKLIDVDPFLHSWVFQ